MSGKIFSKKSRLFDFYIRDHRETNEILSILSLLHLIVKIEIQKRRKGEGKEKKKIWSILQIFIRNAKYKIQLLELSALSVFCEIQSIRYIHIDRFSQKRHSCRISRVYIHPVAAKRRDSCFSRNSEKDEYQIHTTVKLCFRTSFFSNTTFFFC